MGYILDEVTRAASATGTPMALLPTNEANIVRNLIIERFTNGRTGFLWEYFPDQVSIGTPNGWRWIDDFVQGAKAIMFFLDWQEPAIVQFEQGSRIVPVLEEVFGFEFYITSPEVDYVICHNHHDVLIATGAARNWLLERKEQIERGNQLGDK